MPDFSDSCNNILQYAGIGDADRAKISAKIAQFAAMSDQEHQVMMQEDCVKSLPHIIMKYIKGYFSGRLRITIFLMKY